MDNPVEHYKLNMQCVDRNFKERNYTESRIEQLEEEVKELREFKQMMEKYLNKNREQL